MGQQRECVSLAGRAVAPPVFGDEQPRGSRVDSEMPVKALHRGVEDVGVDAFAVTQHEGSNRAKSSLDLIKDTARSRGVFKVRFNTHGPSVGPDGLRRVIRVAAPRHPIVVGRPVRSRDIPTVVREPLHDRRGDASPPPDAGDQGDRPNETSICIA
jgi:hypothetical protein